MLKTTARKVLPNSMQHLVRHALSDSSHWRTNWELAKLREKVWSKEAGALVSCLNYTVRINDGPNFYMLYKDLFIHRIYHFETQRPDPLILDCGSNIGMSILYYKHVYPRARIVGFEPDPTIFPYLEENISNNKLEDVQLHQAAVGGQESVLTFYSDGKYSSCLAEHLPEEGATEAGVNWTKHEVPCVKLRECITEPVDFLKMNIEGAEYEALSNAADRLRQVKEMVVEYHHLPGLPRTLHKILELLHEQGFQYMINDFDSETNGGVNPPFQLLPDTRYYLLIYARRMN